MTTRGAKQPKVFLTFSTQLSISQFKLPRVLSSVFLVLVGSHIGLGRHSEIAIFRSPRFNQNEKDLEL